MSHKYEKAIEELQRLAADEELMDHPDIGPLIRQMTRLVRAQIRVNALSTEAGLMGHLNVAPEKATAEDMVSQALEAEELFDKLRHEFLESAGACSSVSRIYRRMAKEASE